MNPLIEQLKYQFKSGTMTIRLVLANVLVFILIQLLNILERLQIFGIPKVLTSDYFSHYFLHFLSEAPDSHPGHSSALYLRIFHYGIC